MPTPSERSAPGLAKVRRAPLIQRRSVELRAAHAGRWREILDAADVMSEGGLRAEEGSIVYYGTTSVLLPRRSAGGVLPDDEIASLAAILAIDPHVRLRALRIARREATARAGAPLGVLRADVTVGAAPRGVVISVEVSARLASHPLAKRPLDAGAIGTTQSGA